MAFVPSDLSSIIAHWRGEDIPSGTPDPLNWDDVVSAWRLAATGTAIPTYSATAIGGLPGLDFDGSTDKIKTSSTKTLTGQIAIAIIYRKDTGETDAGVCTLSTSTSPAFGADNRLNIRCLTASVFMYGPSTTNREDILGVPVNTDTLMVGCRGTQFGGLRLNGAHVRPSGGNGSTSDFSADACYFQIGDIGSSILLDGKVSEVVIWNESYSDPVVQYVEGFLAHKYSIALPTLHPFYAAAPTAGPSSGGNTLAALQHGKYMGNRGVK